MTNNNEEIPPIDSIYHIMGIVSFQHPPILELLKEFVEDKTDEGLRKYERALQRRFGEKRYIPEIIKWARKTAEDESMWQRTFIFSRYAGPHQGDVIRQLLQHYIAEFETSQQKS